MSDFYKEVLISLRGSLPNNYTDNTDVSLVRPSVRTKALRSFANLILFLMRLAGAKKPVLLINSKLNYFWENIEKFEPTYELLCDKGSRRKFIEILMYKILGSSKVMLSLNNKNYWSARRDIEKGSSNDFVKVKGFRSDLSLFDMRQYGYDLQLYFVANGVFVDFVLQQYNYNDEVCVEDGDVVIDAGGCWGDTALYFASRGASSVFSFEFIPSNLSVFNKNINLNPKYKERIHVIKNAVWCNDGIPLSYLDLGPASKVGDSGVYPEHTETLSIDGLVELRNLQSVDFIKMDIEGAEVSALKGAEATIKKFKPKLAISVYHDVSDMIVIPEYLSGLNPSYKFYLDYYTIVGGEIVLYAIDSNKSE